MDENCGEVDANVFCVVYIYSCGPYCPSVFRVSTILESNCNLKDFPGVLVLVVFLRWYLELGLALIWVFRVLILIVSFHLIVIWKVIVFEPTDGPVTSPFHFFTL